MTRQTQTISRGIQRAGLASLLAIGLFLGRPLVRAALPEIMPSPPFPAPAASIRFTAVDVEIDSGKTPLAAYQIELQTGPATLVGIEGGDPAPFRDAPFYDPAALQQNRVILAAFSLDDPASLPRGPTRIARLHLELPANTIPDLTTRHLLATDAQGQTIEATVRFIPFEGAPK